MICADNLPMNQKEKFTAVVLAADRGAGDPVAKIAGVACKAFAPVGGIPMIIRVLDALEASGAVSKILVCGPAEHVLGDCPALVERIHSGRADWISNLDSPSRSANGALSTIDKDAPVLLTTADHALLTPSIVQHFLLGAQAGSADAAVGVVKYEDVIAAFPGARRTVIRLKDGGFCGCNLYAFLNPQGRGLVSFWQRAEDLRKRPWLLIGQVFGPMLVISYLLGLLSIDRGLHAVSRRTGIKVLPVFLPFPEAGVDVDKAEDLRLAESVLRGNAAIHQ
jgi:GTP:adenosylcobinamide-phosphate guanylyltransferase